eukprot:731328-Amorphochlora_amoeboformis.AAC.1
MCIRDRFNIELNPNQNPNKTLTLTQTLTITQNKDTSDRKENSESSASSQKFVPTPPKAPRDQSVCVVANLLAKVVCVSSSAPQRLQE